MGRIKEWREQGWPGPPSASNAEILRIARLWWQYDDLELVQQITGFEIPESRAEAILMRLAMAKRYWYDRAEEERKRNAR